MNKECKYYKEGTACDRCVLEITEKDIDERWKVISNLENATTHEDLEFGCAQITDALLYLVWDSPDHAGPLFDKRDELIGGQAVACCFSQPGEKFRSWYEYNNEEIPLRNRRC
jgi:hypothetical protein